MNHPTLDEEINKNAANYSSYAEPRQKLIEYNSFVDGAKFVKSKLEARLKEAEEVIDKHAECDGLCAPDECVKDGPKTFEVRQNDRAFQKGDFVTLREWDPAAVSNREVHQLMMIPSQKTRFELGDYTGAYLDFKIGYVLPIDDKRVVFSLIPLEFS